MDKILRLRSPIYSTPLLMDVDDDGQLELFAGGDRIWGWRMETRGKLARLPGWPRAGRGPFASSPRAGDIDGDGRREIVAGSDDDSLYAWRLNGSILPGFPFPTGGDIYSTPVLADLDGDGRMEIIFGSDDGYVYAIDGDGRAVPGWPVRTGGFVSSSPAVADLDGDGHSEVVIGSWDRKLYVLSHRGEIWSAANGHPGWPLQLGHIVWSSPLVFDLDGDGKVEIAVAADLLHVVDTEGRAKTGWPRWAGGFTVSSPVAGALGDSRALVIGGDGLRAFDPHGRLRAGFPFHTGGHVWGRPCIADLDGDGRSEVYAGSWDGRFYGVSAAGSILPGFPIPTAGPVFGGAAAMVSKERSVVAFGSTDGCLRWIEVGPVASHSKRREGVAAAEPPKECPETTGTRLPEASEVSWFLDPDRPLAGRPTYVTLHGIPPSSVRGAFLIYRAAGSDEHPSPFVPSAGRLVALFQPLPAGTEVHWHLVLEGWNGESLRIPERGEHEVQVEGKRWNLPRRLLKR